VYPWKIGNWQDFFEAQMADNKNDTDFGRNLISQIADIETADQNENNFAWSHSSMKQQRRPQPKKSTKETGFSYHPVTSFKREETPQPEPRQQRTLAPNNRDYIKSSTMDRPKTVEKTLEQKNIQDAFNAGKKDFSCYNFSGKDLRGMDFSGANLCGADFSGAILTGANFENADLSDCIMSGATLVDVNFHKAKMHNVLLHNADIAGAFLLEADLDNLTIEELQELVEFLAVNFPQKIRLTRLNLALLDLSKIPLKNLDLRGVDFTGVDFTGINIFELDLSECIITPQQIAQALGRIPTPLELRKILAPKKKKGKSFSGIDMTGLFFNNKEFGVWNTINDKGISIEKLLNTGKRVYSAIAPKPQVKDSDVLEKFSKSQHQTQQREAEQREHQNEGLRRAIEENKRAVLEQMRLEKEHETLKEQEKELPSKEIEKHQERPKINPNLMQRGSHERS